MISARRSFALLALITLAGCGPTIGDPCTVDSQCGGGTCVNRAYAPGGYCSLTCSPTLDHCPVGTVCIFNALGDNVAGCMRVCNAATDCRSGYQCLTQQGSTKRVCMGPIGVP